VPRHKERIADKKGKIGSVTGLAWTSVGGDLLQVDVSVMPGPEKLTLTGQLGDVMKESAQAALSYIRSHTDAFGLDARFHEKKEIHVHLPEGAIPKDGPSAGITLIAAILSALTGIPVRGDVAMTGEITLRGEVLPIGGLTEKLLAARRNGIRTVIIPSENRRNLADVPAAVKEGLVIIPVKSVDEAIPLLFMKPFPNPAKR
jgi:ATP-dependent Lon protease